MTACQRCSVSRSLALCSNLLTLLFDRYTIRCDADPDALSSYILALLQRDQPMEALRDSCLSELEEFLGHETSHFVSGLFSLIADLSSEGHSVSSSHRKRHHDGSSRSRNAVYSSYDNKRHRHDERYRHHDHPRRQSDEYHRVNDDYGRSLLDVPPPSSRHFDDRRVPMPRHSHYNEYRSPVPSSSPYVSRIRPHSPVMNQMSPPPRSSSRWPANNNSGAATNGQAPSSSAPPEPELPHPERKQHGERHHQYDRGNDRSHHPRSPTNLMIANVPRELNNLSSLSAHFSRFGEIVNIQIKANVNRAFIQYRTHEQAKKALSCPEAVCNNRFIKVGLITCMWYGSC